MFWFALYGLGALILVLLSLGLIFLRIPSYRTYKYAEKIPGPRKLSIIGLAVDFAMEDFTTILPLIQKISDNHNGLFMGWLLGTPMVVMERPEDLEVIMGSAQHTKKGVEYDLLSGWLNEGLLVSHGKKWKQRRKLLTPSFHFKILENNLLSLNKHARTLVNILKENKGQPVDVLSYISLCTLDVICETAMGVSVKAQEQQGKDYINSITHVSSGVLFRFMNPHLRDWLFNLLPIGRSFNKHVKKLHDYTEKVIKKRKELYKEDKKNGRVASGEKQRHAFLDMLIEMQSANLGVETDLDIREEVDTFMFEGHDTTSSGLTFAIFRLALHQEVQEKAYDEQYAIFGDSDRVVENEDLLNMPYLTKVIKETLRLYPSVPFISRKLTQDALCGDVIVPEGANVSILTYLTHRRADLYPEPEVFDPERFAPDEIAKRHPFAYIPFSAGPRNCIGQKFAMMELKVVLSTILRKFILKPVTKLEDVILVPAVILRSQIPIEVQFISRD